MHECVKDKSAVGTIVAKKKKEKKSKSADGENCKSNNNNTIFLRETKQVAKILTDKILKVHQIQ
jgi:hypothetical protein